MSTPLISRCFVESDSTTAAAFAAQTLRKPTQLARPCLPHGNSVRPGGHSRGTSMPAMRSDLLALPACRLGGAVKIGFARKTLTRPRVRSYYWATHDQSSHLALPHH